MKNNGDAKNSMLDAGFSPATAHRSTCVKIVKECQQEILAEIKEKVTVEYVLAELDRVAKLAETAEDFSSVIRAKELLGKYLAMFTERSEITQIDSEENQFSLSRLTKMQQETN